MNNAVTIGNSYVGKATAHALGIKDYYTRHDSTVKREELSNFKYVFICVPTPTIDGKQDISAIEEYVSDVKLKDSIFIIRSTILPNTTRVLSERYGVKIVHVPEFFTESTWMQDSEWPDIVVVGADDEGIREEVAGIFRARFKGTEMIVTDSITAELIKYSINCFYATKVVFANQIYDYAESIGANYETIKKAMYARKWMSTNHLDVWNKGGRGAGGKCLEKDLSAFSNIVDSALLKVANDLNKKLLKDFPRT
jgi:UDPglucose 6-dehydrogenase